MPHLPADVLVPILQFAYAWPESATAGQRTFTTRRAWIASTLLIGRAWYAAGQPLLYRRVTVYFHSKWQVNSLLRTLNSPNRVAVGTVAQNIRELRIIKNPYEEMRHDDDIFPVPMIPFVTKRGQRWWTRTLQYGKLRRLLAQCSALRHLALHHIHIPKLAPAIEKLWTLHHRLDRIEVHDMNWLPDVHWSLFTQHHFWSHLSALTFHVRSLPVVDEPGQLRDLDLAIERGCLRRLESLDVGNDVRPMVLQKALGMAQSTLRTLICDQPTRISLDMSDEAIFSPVATTLTSLTLTLSAYATLIDLSSSMTALIRLTLILTSSGAPSVRSGSQQPPLGRPLSVHVFPQTLHTIEWRAKAGVDPWMLAERVRDTVRALDHDRLTGLRSITVTATLRMLRQVGLWTILAALLHGITQTQPGVQLRVDLLLDLNHFELQRFDCFARQMDPGNRHRLEGWKQKLEQRDEGWKRVLHRGLEIGGTTIACLRGSVCCILYMGCFCCVFGHYFTFE